MERIDGGPEGPQRPVQAVHVEGRVPSTSEDPFPKVVGRTRIPTTLEIAETIDSAGQKVIDPVVFRSVSNMEAGQ